jgi:hypothetical protein
VSEALIRKDEVTLRRLFHERVMDVGGDTASREWLEIASTLDSSAQTG